METLTVEDVQRCMAARVPIYSWRKPIYQYVALNDLRQLWDPGHRSALDVGGGTGLMAYAVKELFALGRVATVDIHDRFLPSLEIETAVYDGQTLPFADGSFDCILLFNVLHHVPIGSRARLLEECRRVAGRGPVYIKDHLSLGRVDDARLTILDLLGNLPFGGMVSASYLRDQEWRDLASATGHDPGEYVSGRYRSGLMAGVFPNRLEISMRWCPAR